MLYVDLRCAEFMDRVPVARAALHVVLAVTPYYWHAAGESGETGGPPEQHSHATIEPELDLAETFEADVVTDAAGNARVQFQPSAAWGRVAQIKLNDALPRVVRGHISVSAAVPWLDLHISVRQVIVDEPDASPTVMVLVDPAKLIVGHTTTTSTRLWFQLHGDPKPGYQFVAELAVGETTTPRRESLAFTTGVLRTCVAPIAGLRAGTTYSVQLIAEEISTGARAVLARGSVRTMRQNPSRWDIAFTTCNKPRDYASLAAWIRRAARPSADQMLMLGDQIYTSGLDESDTDAAGWFARHVRRYNRLWNFQSIRDVLRRTPTYMMIDDHEVEDDYGIVPLEEIGRERWRQAMTAYRRFQDPLNPPGRGSNVWDYGWRSGPIAYYVLDERVHRGADTSSNVLGVEQLARFRAWAESADTRQADVVIIGSPVPFAFLPIEQLRSLVFPAAATAGALGGALLGGIFGGPAGAIIGAVAGALGLGIGVEEYASNLHEPDFHDHWTYQDNQPELAKVLEILFDLANDITNGTPGPRPRAVVVLGGDIHLGGVYLLRSGRKDGGHDHRRNNLIFQFVSSPSSAEVTSHPALNAVINAVGHDVNLGGAEFLKSDPDVQADNPLDVSRFVLDAQGERHYAAEFLASLFDYNFGSLVIERSGPRAYRFNTAVEGSANSLTALYEIDLDAPVVRPRDLIGERLSTTGTPVMVRVHEQGSGYGPLGDRLDAEAVVQLDREPGRSFGFTLRDDAGGASHRGMLSLLRRAFNSYSPVTIEYDRTGPRNGKIVRVHQA